VGLEQGSLILVSTLEELLERKSSDSSLKTEITAVAFCRADYVTSIYLQKVDTNSADKGLSRSRYSSLADSGHRGFYFFDQNQSTVTIGVITKEVILCMVPRKHNFHIIYTGWTCIFLTLAAILGVQMGEISLNRPWFRLYLCSLVCTSKGLLICPMSYTYICHNHMKCCTHMDSHLLAISNWSSFHHCTKEGMFSFENGPDLETVYNSPCHDIFYLKKNVCFSVAAS
jgi:hypothetical protein